MTKGGTSPVIDPMGGGGGGSVKEEHFALNVRGKKSVEDRPSVFQKVHKRQTDLKTTGLLREVVTIPLKGGYWSSRRMTGWGHYVTADNLIIDAKKSGGRGSKKTLGSSYRRNVRLKGGIGG